MDRVEFNRVETHGGAGEGTKSRAKSRALDNPFPLALRT
jgi:hypothetical protein